MCSRGFGSELRPVQVEDYNNRFAAAVSGRMQERLSPPIPEEIDLRPLISGLRYLMKRPSSPCRARIPGCHVLLLGARMSHILALGLKSLMLHRLRSILTTMGMVFGVASVIAMLAIGEGANFEAQQQIQELGSQNIILRTIKPPEEQNKQQRQAATFSITV